MLAYTYISKGNFRFQEKPIPQIFQNKIVFTYKTSSQ